MYSKRRMPGDDRGESSAILPNADPPSTAIPKEGISWPSERLSRFWHLLVSKSVWRDRGGRYASCDYAVCRPGPVIVYIEKRVNAICVSTLGCPKILFCFKHLKTQPPNGKYGCYKETYVWGELVEMPFRGYNY